MESILSSIIQHISEELPGDFSLVDEDYGQLENLDDTSRDMYPITFPAVLVSESGIMWENLQGDNQKGTATIIVRLMIDCYDDTHIESDTVDKIQERELLRHHLHSTLQGFRIGNNSLNRTTSRFSTWNHGIKIYETDYSLCVDDYVEKYPVKIKNPRIILRQEPILPG